MSRGYDYKHKQGWTWGDNPKIRTKLHELMDKKFEAPVRIKVTSDEDKK